MKLWVHPSWIRFRFQVRITATKINHIKLRLLCSERSENLILFFARFSLDINYYSMFKNQLLLPQREKNMR